jgi:very-short-patch-repair endonuclease/predicted transcriptional regulator of viral defense system
MDDRLALLISGPQPFTAAEAAAWNIDQRTLTRLAHAGVLHRVDRGAYVPTTVWRGASPEQRHLLRCRAVLGRYRAAVLSHTSAIVAHGLPTYRVDLGVVHVTRTRPGRIGRVARRRPVQVHPELPGAATRAVDGLPTCTVAVAVLQVADWHGVGTGMVAAEAALHRGVVDRDDLRRARELVRLGHGRAAADLVVDLASACSESPGETLTRLVLRSLGHTDVVQQVPIRLPGGRNARVDFLLPALGVVVEFDGAVKYEGAQGRDELVREKRREDGLRATGLEVVRLTSPDLDRPQHVAGLVDAAAARASRHTDRPVPTAIAVPRPERPTSDTTTASRPERPTSDTTTVPRPERPTSDTTTAPRPERPTSDTNATFGGGPGVRIASLEA